MPSGAADRVTPTSRYTNEQNRAEAKFRGLLEAAPDAMVCVEPDGRIALVNAETERLFGYTRDELVGRPFQILVPDHEASAHPTARRRDGTAFAAEISLGPLESGEGELVLVAVRDVSERLEAQAERERLRAQAASERFDRQLHQSQRLEILGQLAGGVAHDFNNLLAVILNYASFVADEIHVAANEVDGEPWQMVLADVEQIRRAAERAAALTRQLLAFGRREVVRPRVLDLNEVVSEVEQLLRRTIGEDVELVTALEPDLWRVSADPGQIEQILVNLAVNARDAMPAGGTLTIDSDNVTVGEDSPFPRPDVGPGRYVRLRVSDTGTGMDKDTLDHAFEPFFTTKPKGEGTGLGLATVYGIVAQADGDAQVVSEPGVGTTFSVVIPETDDAIQIADEPVVASREANGETILVVEDEDAMREVTRRILTRHGYRVIASANGPEALTLVSRLVGDVDLLLTDIVMPQMLGKEVAERITQVRPGLRVLYMSGYARPVLASKGTLEPGIMLIEKPFSAPQLLAMVREALDSARPRPVGAKA